MILCCQCFFLLASSWTCVCNIVEVYPESPNARSGMNVTIHCVTDSEESRKWGVAWEFLRNDSHLPRTICHGSNVPLLQWNKKYECKSDGNKHSLFIQNLTFSDYGNYVCTEDRGRGPGKGSFELLISPSMDMNTVVDHLFVSNGSAQTTPPASHSTFLARVIAVTVFLTVITITTMMILYRIYIRRKRNAENKNKNEGDRLACHDNAASKSEL